MIQKDKCEKGNYKKKKVRMIHLFVFLLWRRQNLLFTRHSFFFSSIHFFCWEKQFLFWEILLTSNITNFKGKLFFETKACFYKKNIKSRNKKKIIGFKCNRFLSDIKSNSCSSVEFIPILSNWEMFEVVKFRFLMHGNMFGLKSNHFWSLKIKFWDQTKKYDFETNLQDQLAVLG